MYGRSLYGNREIFGFGHRTNGGPHREGDEPKPMMNDPKKSDPLIVAMKPTNKTEQSMAESAERRRGTKGNTGQCATRRTQSRASVPSGLDRVRRAAKANRKARFTALLHHVDVALLRSSYHWLKRDAAPGVDGVTWREYGVHLEANLEDLCARVQRGAYRAQPTRRRYIPKPDGRQRPLGIAALEDKIVQRAVVEVLNAIYEADFLGFSHGFRPGRSQHDALDALAYGIKVRRVNWILDADIRSFFDTVNHDWLVRFIEHRVADRRVLRLIRKWLKAGVMEGGTMTATIGGTPQGAVISPLLANIYLHYIFDLWAHRWRRRQARGEIILVRYADDIVAGLQHEADAQAFLLDLRERFTKFELSLHSDKTRLIEFGRYAAENRKRRGEGKPETFSFLGFIHIASFNRSGRFILTRKSRRDRMRSTLQVVKTQLRRRMHDSIPQQGQWLAQVVRGYFAYHAVPTNASALKAFRYYVSCLWLRTLRRRSQRDVTTWEKMTRLVEQWLPPVRITHPWPDERFDVKHPRWEPSAGIPLARICAGGVR
jgi:RNA-directed DNA polymerase